MLAEIYNPCEDCPYNDNGWCCIDVDFPDDALCMEECEDDQTNRYYKM